MILVIWIADNISTKIRELILVTAMAEDLSMDFPRGFPNYTIDPSILQAQLNYTIERDR